MQALAQVAAGLRDPNTMTEAELTMLPNYSAAIAKATVAARPFPSIVDFDKFLGAQGLNPEQRAAVYNRAFVHVNLNTASEAEIMLIPNVGKRMAHEFEDTGRGRRGRSSTRRSASTWTPRRWRA